MEMFHVAVRRIEQKNADAWMLAFMRDFHSKLFGDAAEDVPRVPVWLLET